MTRKLKATMTQALATITADPLPSVPVLGRLVLSWPTLNPVKPWSPNDLAISAPIDQALAYQYDCDAHFVPYVSDRRLNTQAIGKCRATMTLFVVDVDAPNHAPPTPEWRATEREKVRRLETIAPGYYAFETRGGYRLVWLLSEPQDLDSPADAALWPRVYCAWLAWLEREAGIVGDASCADWTRCYRLPFVRRDGEDQRLPTSGDLRAGTWDLMRGREFITVAAVNTNADRITVSD